MPSSFADGGAPVDRLKGGRGDRISGRARWGRNFGTANAATEIEETKGTGESEGECLGNGNTDEERGGKSEGGKLGPVRGAVKEGNS